MTSEQALSCSSRNSFFTAKGRVWIMHSHRFQLCRYFLAGQGTGSALLGVTAQREADSTPLRQGFHSSHPGRFATNHKTSPLPQEDTEKATRLLIFSLISKNFSCKRYAREILVPSVWFQLSVSPHIPSAASQGCVWEGHSRSKATDTVPSSTLLFPVQQAPSWDVF